MAKGFSGISTLSDNTKCEELPKINDLVDPSLEQSVLVDDESRTTGINGISLKQERKIFVGERTILNKGRFSFTLIVGIGIIGGIFFLRSDFWVWQKIKNVNTPSEYRRYMNENPTGKFYFNAKKHYEQLKYESLKSLTKPYSIDSIKRFLSYFPEDTVTLDNQVFYDMKESNFLSYQDTFSYLWKYEIMFPDGKHLNEIISLIDKHEKIVWETIQFSSDEKTLETICNEFKNTDIIRKAKQQINLLYSNFTFVTQKNTKYAYERFIALTPNAPEVLIAEKRIIDIEVAEIKEGEHGEYTPSPPSRYYQDSNSENRATVNMENTTNFTITVRYSGIDSFKKVIPPKQTREVVISPGVYKIAVTTQQRDVRPFYGTNDIKTGGHYSESFHITSSQLPLRNSAQSFIQELPRKYKRR